MSHGTKALFLDRDGTLIVDKHYLADPAGVELLAGVPEALRHARALGYRLFLFTNQSGVARGYYTLEDVRRCNARMQALIGLGEIFADTCIAPELPSATDGYRKPSPRYIVESVARHRLDPAQCWMVGDRESDVRAGLGAGIRAGAVCSAGHGARAWAALAIPGVPVFAALRDFAATLA